MSSALLARRIPATAAVRPALPRAFARAPQRSGQARLQVRFQSRATATEPTTPPPPPPSPPRKKKNDSWRGTFLRWGAAGGAVWWYLNSPVFADEPEPRFVTPPQFVDEDQATVAAVVAKKRAELLAIEEAREKAKKDGKEDGEQPNKSSDQTQKSAESAPSPQQSPDSQPVTDEEARQAGEDAQGAFNPETGEINWDCPCLGGMAHGPCGPEFREAFSCFVFSESEPKGMDCIDKFQGMQECFRKHPEVYAEELRDDAPAVDKPEGAAENSGDKTPAKDQTETAQAAPAGDKPAASAPKPASNDSTPKDSNTHPAKSVEDLDRRLDARGLVTDASEAEEGRHVDASDANKEAKKEAKAKKEKK